MPRPEAEEAREEMLPPLEVKVPPQFELSSKLNSEEEMPAFEGEIPAPFEQSSKLTLTNSWLEFFGVSNYGNCYPDSLITCKILNQGCAASPSYNGRLTINAYSGKIEAP